MSVIVDDQYWMNLALEQAELAKELGEVPVGAVLVDKTNKLISSAHNAPISQNDPTSHAEINVIRKASKQLNNYRLIDTTLYVTLEPCVMCVGAMIHSRIARVVYGAKEYKTGAIESQFQLLTEHAHNHKIEVTEGVLKEPCSHILSNFFKQRRLEKKHD